MLASKDKFILSIHIMRYGVERITTVVFSPILPRFYDYIIVQYDLRSGALRQIGSPFSITVGAIEIEYQTNNHWWIFLAANYHDSFYYTYFDPTKAIPTQVTGAVGESLATVVMQKLYQARNVRRITPHPSSKAADFEMDINLSGQVIHALVESKGSNVNSPHPYFPTISQGTLQLLASRRARRSGAGYLIITSYPARRCFVIRVF